MRVRGITLSDKSPWLAMRRHLRPGVDEGVHERDWRRLIERRAEHTALLALGADGEVIGLVEVSRRGPSVGSSAPSHGYVDLVHVEQGHPREAVARRLLDAAAAWAQARGCRELATEVDTDNHWDQKLSEQLGFEELGRYVRYRRAIEVETPVAEAEEPAGETRMPPEVAVLPVAATNSVPQDIDPLAGQEDAPGPLEYWRGRAAHIVLCILGLAAFYFTDVWSGGVFTGVVLPFVDVLFVIYVLTLIVMVKYRRRTDSEDRALSLFDAVRDQDAPRQ